MNQAIKQLDEPSDVNDLHAKFMHNAFWISFWMVFAVPSAAFSAVSAASRGVSESTVLGVVSWFGAAAASAVALICATVLMVYSRAPSKPW